MFNANKINGKVAKTILEMLIANHHHHHHHHHTGIYNAPITIEREHGHSTIQYRYAVIKMANLLNIEGDIKKWVFSLFLKTVLSDMEHSSAGRLFHEDGPANEKAHSQMRCDVAGGIWGRTQVGTSYCSRRELQYVGEIMWSLPSMDIVHHNT